MNFLEYPYFPNEKTKENRKPPKDGEIGAALRNNPNLFAPVHFDSVEDKLVIGSRRIDGIIRAEWKRKIAHYAYEYKAYSTPNSVQMAIDQLRATELPGDLLPLVIVPYLNQSQLDMLDAIDMSGMDLCGNGVLVSPDYHIWRTGYPNKYKDTRPIRNPFAGDSSVFARCFLLQREFASLTDLRNFAIKKAYVAHTKDNNKFKVAAPDTLLGSYSLGTASKVIKTLEEELVVRKDKQTIVLQDIRRLLTLLRQSQRHQAPQMIVGKTSLPTNEIWSRLAELSKGPEEFRSVATGIASASYYNILSGVDKLSFYVDNLDLAREALDIMPGKAFANIELIEDYKNAAYFDARRQGVALWSSPIQTWLEISSAGPREREAAAELETLWIRGETL